MKPASVVRVEYTPWERVKTVYWDVGGSMSQGERLGDRLEKAEARADEMASLLLVARQRLCDQPEQDIGFINEIDAALAKVGGKEKK